MNWYYCELSGIDRDGYFKSMIYTSIADKYENVKTFIEYCKNDFSKRFNINREKISIRPMKLESGW